MALLYLLRRADVEVTAIVVDGDGEARCPRGATNALSLAALAGKPDIPVGCGRPRPLKGPHAFPKAWRDAADNLWGLPRPARPARPPAGSGERVLRAALQSAPGRVDVLTLGPPTELAAVLLRRGAALRAKIRSVTMMGGAVGVPGNITLPPTIKNPHAEWNFYVDPIAANVVFRSGLPITLVPLDATNDVPLNAAVAARLGRSPSAAFVRRLIKSMPPSLLLLGPACRRRPRRSGHRQLRQQAARRHRTRRPGERPHGSGRRRREDPRRHVCRSGAIRELIRLDPALTAMLRPRRHSRSAVTSGPASRAGGRPFYCRG